MSLDSPWFERLHKAVLILLFGYGIISFVHNTITLLIIITIIDTMPTIHQEDIQTRKYDNDDPNLVFELKIIRDKIFQVESFNGINSVLTRVCD